MKMALIATTRPRMSSGVSSCVRVRRVTTLMLSAAPVKASAAIESQTLLVRPNTTVARPNAATDVSKRGPPNNTANSMPDELRATALGNRARSTSKGVMACCAGI
jgi:hypothetical protein